MTATTKGTDLTGNGIIITEAAGGSTRVKVRACARLEGSPVRLDITETGNVANSSVPTNQPAVEAEKADHSITVLPTLSVSYTSRMVPYISGKLARWL
ncbi:MAG TPA: hypothetical protein DIT35_07710 [Rhodospirillaceae bacterium]|nr:hypothetical protein [Rhodospirillaceae bacterium]